MFAEGLDRAPRPCTYSNKCLVNFVENPLGCYDESRYASRDEMIDEIMSVFDAPAFRDGAPRARPLGERARPHLRAARVPQPAGQEPSPALEHRRRFDAYDGSGSQTRINWELKFARGGVGAIVSAFVPVDVRGRIVPNYASIDRDERIPFSELGRRVHEHGCAYILQLAQGAPARSPRDRVREGPVLHRQARSPARLRVRARHPRPAGRDRGGVRRGADGRSRQASTASRSTAPTATSSRSSSPPPSTTARTTTAARCRTGRVCCSRRCGRSASGWATTSTSR